MLVTFTYNDRHYVIFYENDTILFIPSTVKQQMVLTIIDLVIFSVKSIIVLYMIIK